ncbi:hypothetical protein Tco_1482747, partial [Tanacetum coccineum]
PVGLAAATEELSPTSNLGPGARHNLFQGGNTTSEISALRSVEGRSKGNDGGCNGGDGNGNGDAALNQILAAL